MKRTTDKPKKPGWYFVERPEADHPEVLKLEIDDSGETIAEDLSYWLLDDGQGSITYLNDDPVGTRYAGPIDEPSDDYSVYDLIRQQAERHGLSNAGIHTCFHLGFNTYLECIRCGAYFPHHK